MGLILEHRAAYDDDRENIACEDVCVFVLYRDTLLIHYVLRRVYIVCTYVCRKNEERVMTGWKIFDKRTNQEGWLDCVRKAPSKGT